MAGGSVVGLDIGTNQIKVVECRKSSRGVEVTALGHAPTPVEAYENSVIVDPQALGRAVKDLMKQAGVSAKQCVSAVAGPSSVVVRVIDVPQMNPAELAETMKWEVERHVPFAVSEVVMDYKLIDRPEGYAEGQQMEVLMAVAQQNFVDQHVEMLFAAGLKPLAVDVEPLAVGRALLELGTGHQPAGHTVAIVNIGATVTEIGIYRDKLLSFPRTLPIAGENLTRAIADAFSCDLQTAETLKLEEGEVLAGQVPPQGGFGGAPFGGAPSPSAASGGFLDFSQGGAAAPNPFAPPAAQPNPFAPAPAATPDAQTYAPSSPSGRMDFDFSAPGDAPPPSPFGAGGAMAPASGPLGGPADAQAAPPTDAGFITPAGYAPPAADLPAVTSPAAGSGRNVQVFNAMAPVLSEIVQELRRSLDYYRGRVADAQIHQILLTGGTARLPGLARFLETELGIPTAVADTFAGVQVTSKNYSAGHMDQVGTLFPISIGLAAAELLPSPPSAKKARK